MKGTSRRKTAQTGEGTQKAGPVLSTKSARYDENLDPITPDFVSKLYEAGFGRGEERGVLKQYFPERDEFEKDINGSTEDEKAVTHAFAKALQAERGKTEYSAAGLANAISDLAYSGRLGEWFAQAAALSKRPPIRLPEAAVQVDNETPAHAITRIFGYWLDRKRMHQGVVRTLSQDLYEQFYSWKRYNAVPPDLQENLPTRKDFNTRLLAGTAPDDLGERLRLQKLSSLRSLSKK